MPQKTTVGNEDGKRRGGPTRRAPKSAGAPDYDAILDKLRQIDASFVTATENRFATDIARGAAATDHLISALRSSDTAERADAAEALGVVRDTRALAPLRGLLSDPAPEVRGNAAIALVKVGDEALFPEIVKGLRDENPKVVIGAAVALGRIADRRVVPNLVEAFKTDDTEVGSAVAWALGQCGDPAALPWLITAVEQGFAAPNACEALGRIGDPKAAPALIKALAAPSDDTRAYSARALGMLRHAGSSGAVGARMGQLAANQVVPALKRTLKDRSKKVRLCASIALYELGEKVGGRQLVEELTG